MTIEIPDDLLPGLEGAAILQSKSVEEVAVESLRLLFENAASPQNLLLAIRNLPHPSAGAVDDMEAAILSARLPVRNTGTFERL